MATKEELKGLGQNPVEQSTPAEPATSPLMLQPGQVGVATMIGQPCHCQAIGWKRPLVYGLIGAGVGTFIGYMLGRLMAK